MMNAMKTDINAISLDTISAGHEEEHVKDMHFISADRNVTNFISSENSFIINGIYLSLLMNGTGEMKVNGRTYPVAPMSVILLPPNEIVELRNCSPDAEWISVIASFDLILEFPTPLDTDILTIARRLPVLSVTEEKMERMKDIYLLMEREHSCHDNRYTREICKSLLYVLLLEISDEYRKQEGMQAASRMKQEKLSDDFFLLLAKWYKKERRVGFYADKLNRTPKYLSTAIKSLTGRSATEWINETVIREIKVMLKTSDMTVLQISEAMNFPNPSAFVQFFKQHTGTTPLKYRRE